MVYYTKEEEIDMSNLKEIIIKYIKKNLRIFIQRERGVLSILEEKRNRF